MNLQIRQSREEDAAFIERLFSLPHVGEFLNAPARSEILTSIGHPDAENLILERDGAAAGNLVLYKQGFLVDVTVLAVAQPRCGLGTLGLQWALRRAFSELRAHRVFLEVREDNAVMRALVERLGFAQEGVYRDGFMQLGTGKYFNLCPYGMLEAEYRRV